MRLYPLCCLLLLTGCFGRDTEAVKPRPEVPADLLQACAGYTGPLPQTEGQMSDALIAEARGRSCANGKLATVADILNPSSPFEG
ncbi:hypothetical protein [Pseudophaeobacter sp.]|uniref:hypothetical protein n=1 Tax=Pseudophaeobacter sp. TaxID=1971739 RepID=UPI00329692A7